MKLNISVCAYDSVNAVSGPATWFQRVVPLLAAEGHRVTVHLFWWEHEQCGTLRRFTERSGFRLFSHRFSSAESNVRALLTDVADEPPDILIADNVVPALLASPILKAAGTRTIGIIRSDDPFYHGIIERFAAGPEKYRVYAFVAVSDFLCDQVLKASKGKGICRSIPSGAPIPSQRAAWNSRQFQIVYSGRLVQEQKRIIETTSCMIRLCQKVDNVRCVVIGDGPLRQEVESMILASRAPITVVGSQSPEEVQRILLQSQAILLLSDYEGTPTAVMEAMACGVVPICLSIRSGVPQLVQHEKTGMIVSDRGDSCLRAVRELAGSRDLWEQLSRSARDLAERAFSIDICARRWLELISEVKGSGPTRRLAIPGTLRLPASHRGFAHQDLRDPTLFERLVATGMHLFRRSRFHAGRIRRRVFGQLLGTRGNSASDFRDPYAK
jgi:colanic acid/amylovoran biosynthesis glycosyltransferase